MNNKWDASASFFIGEGGGVVDARLKKCDGSIKKGGARLKKRAGSRVRVGWGKGAARRVKEKNMPAKLKKYAPPHN